MTTTSFELQRCSIDGSSAVVSVHIDGEQLRFLNESDASVVLRISTADILFAEASHSTKASVKVSSESPSSSSSPPRNCSTSTSSSQQYAHVYYAERRKTRLVEHTVVVDTGAETHAHRLVGAIEAALLELRHRPRRLLVFVNPISGKRRAPAVYTKQVEPVLQRCHIQTQVVETKYANHAHDVISQHSDIAAFDGILLVGGDGLFNEGLRALIHLAQQSSELDLHSWRNELRRVPDEWPILGVIPAGSMNALSGTMYGRTADASTAALHVVLGHQRRVDVASLHTHDRMRRLAVTAMAFGFLGDVALLSERMRAFGPARYLIAGTKAMLRNRSYTGIVRYLCDETTAEKENHNNSSIEADENNHHHSVFNMPRCTANAGCPRCDAETNIIEPEQWDPTCWPRICASWLHVIAAVTPCMCDLAPDGLSPVGHLGDGCIDLALVRRQPLVQAARLFLRVQKRHHNHLQSDRIQLTKVRAFSYEPIVSGSRSAPASPKHSQADSCVLEARNAECSVPGLDLDTSHEDESVTAKPSKNRRCGIWNVDGEVFEQGNETLYFRAHRKTVRIFGCGLADETAAAATT